MIYFDREGRPVALEEWARLARDADYRFVGFDQSHRFRISTVWTGEDRSDGRCAGPPLIFETTVYEGRGDAEVTVELYATMTDALDGHQQLTMRFISAVDMLAALGRASVIAPVETPAQRAATHPRHRRTPRPR